MRLVGIAVLDPKKLTDFIELISRVTDNMTPDPACPQPQYCTQSYSNGLGTRIRVLEREAHMRLIRTARFQILRRRWDVKAILSVCPYSRLLRRLATLDPDNGRWRMCRLPRGIIVCRLLHPPRPQGEAVHSDRGQGPSLQLAARLAR